MRSKRYTCIRIYYIHAGECSNISTQINADHINPIMHVYANNEQARLYPENRSLIGFSILINKSSKIEEDGDEIGK